MFANVVRARVINGELGQSGKEVAIKIVRCQESMFVIYYFLDVNWLLILILQVPRWIERSADSQQTETS